EEHDDLVRTSSRRIQLGNSQFGHLNSRPTQATSSGVKASVFENRIKHCSKCLGIAAASFFSFRTSWASIGLPVFASPMRICTGLSETPSVPDTTATKSDSQGSISAPADRKFMAGEYMMRNTMTWCVRRQDGS